MKSRWAGPALVALLVFGSKSHAQTNTYQLRADVYGRAEPGVAVLSLQGQAESKPWVSAEAFVWGGLREDLSHDGVEGDVLVVSVTLRDPNRHVQLELGRFITGRGAIRPVQIDGAELRLRLPWSLRAELWGGAPVAPRFRERDFDWLVGGRLSRALGEWGSIGIAYQHRRDGGQLADEEIGADLGFTPLEWLNLHGRVAYDLITYGVSEARATAAMQHDIWRIELFADHRSPSRILPATSLFSVLGDVASRRLGSSFDVQAAPRLAIYGTASVRLIGNEAGEAFVGGTELQLDETGASAVEVEVRREGVARGDWTGIRLAARIAVVEGVAFSTEGELVIPDDPQERGTVWPWGLVGLTWDPAARWRVAGAIQASASPARRARVDGTVRITHRLEGSGW